MHGSLLQQAETEARFTRTPHMPSPNSLAHHFLKDGRTISIGDCALFKPPQESPPFIGIIRALLYSKENHLQLRVNWLYRPADLKLGKGIFLEAAPNEIFYSFHKDKIPAASLLHPCKVAFLPKGVELPSGTFAFVCRRVYDIESRRLWWLTDQDYINERQDEVDQLLYKTRVEMHATVPTGGRSAKPINGPTSTSQLKSEPDSMQNTSFSCQGKGKKRERGGHCSDPVKRERSMKMDDGDSGQLRTESSLKSEIAKITERGGLVDPEGVDQLVQFMQIDKVGKKMDLICRSMLAGVLAATDKFDCLNRFVQLRGLPVLDEWLQNIHKGKIGDGSSSKDGDKSVEEFLLVLLRALDKLPVNLHALQMCNIGRSVNQLRSHKNLEIQKKARSLVDTWKKRVEAEMNIIDAKSGSNQAAVTWPSKSRLPEASHGGNRVSVGSGDNAVKSSVTQLSASRTTINKLSPGETTKSASSSPGPVKSASSSTSVKEGQSRNLAGSASEVTPATREDKSSSSSQSHNYGHSPPGKEDAKSPTAGSSSAHKVSSGGSRHRKLIDSFPGPSVSSGGLKDASNRSLSLHKNSPSEKLTPTEDPDMPVEGSTPKLIVKVPNVGRIPGQCAGSGSVEDHSIMSGAAASPVVIGKNDQLECSGKDRSDTFQAELSNEVNVESIKSNNLKDLVVKPDNGDQLSASLPHEEQTRNSEEVKISAEICKASSVSFGDELKSAILHNGSAHSSFRSMNALVESCVKYFAANSSMSTGDDVGMNLLASVAAGEMSKSDLVSSLGSPHRSGPAEEVSIADDARSKPSSGNVECDSDDKKQVVPSSGPDDGSRLAIYASPDLDADNKALTPACENKLGAVSVKFPNSSSADLRTAVCCSTELDEKKGSTSFSPVNAEEKQGNGEQNRPLNQENSSSHQGVAGTVQPKPSGSSVGGLEVILDVDNDLEKVGILSDPLLQDDDKHHVTENLNAGCCETLESPSKVPDGRVLPVHVSGCDMVVYNVGDLKARSADGKDSKEVVGESEKGLLVKDSDAATGLETGSIFHLLSAGMGSKTTCMESGDEIKQALGCVEDGQTCVEAKESKISGGEGEEKECTSMAEASSSSGGPDTNSKMNFDLNEGFDLDDGKFEEQALTTGPLRPSKHQIINPMPVTASSSITVAAAAKGPFVPREDLTRSKGELGWKGSAATSAFRPAEPRKFLQAPSGSVSTASANTSACKPDRIPLDFDLNVPDERVLEDLASRDLAKGICSSSDLQNNQDNSCSTPFRTAGGLDLDLNRTDETSDMGLYSACNGRKLEHVTVAQAKSFPLGGVSASELRQDFDLNNGPCVDDADVEQPLSHQHATGCMHGQPPVEGLRINSAEIGNFSSWLSSGNTYSTVIHPSILADRAQQPIIPSGAPTRILGPGGTPFTPDVYRGSVLASSHAVPFLSNPFQYPVNHFGTTFPLPSSSFAVGSTSFIDPASSGRLFPPSSNAQLMGPVEAISSQYPRSFVSHPEGNRFSSAESWGKQGLDLNAGPASLDVEGRVQQLAVASNRLPLAISQSAAEEQAKMFSVRGGVLKRKEFDGGWDNDSFSPKQPSWR